MEKAHAGDVHIQNFLKKKMMLKHRELMKLRAAGEGGAAAKVEPGCASPALLEEQPAESEEGHKRKKKSTKLKKQQQQEQEISGESGWDASQRNKKKQKHNGSADKPSCVACVKVNQHSVDDSWSDADYVYVQKPAKKKRKLQLPEEDEVPALETPGKKDSKGLKKKKKKDKKKKKRCRSSQDAEEDTSEAGNRLLVSIPERKRQRRSTEKGGVAVPQLWHEDGDCDDASVLSEGSADVPLKPAKPAKAADPSQKASVQPTKPKSCTSVTKEKPPEYDGR